METTFLISESELDKNFLKSLKTLFKHQSQLQITVSVPEDFNLLQAEAPEEYIARLERNLKEVKENKNTIAFTEAQLDDMILEKL